jgi:hypothetical protein
VSIIINYYILWPIFARFLPLHITACTEGLMLARTVSRAMSGNRSATQRTAALAKHMSTNSAETSVLEVCYLS